MGMYDEYIPPNHKCTECGLTPKRTKFSGRKYIGVTGKVSYYYRPICTSCRHDIEKDK